MYKYDVFVVFSFVMISLFSAFFLGLQTPQGIGLFMILYGLSIIGPLYLFIGYFKKFTLNEASMRELEAEDSIFLQGVAFSQSTLWIVLNLIAQDGIIVFLKWFIPVTAGLCYSMRAYAKLKNNNKWRYYSVIVLSLVFAGSLSSIIRIVLIPTWENLMLIENIDVTNWIIVPPLAQIPVILAVSLRTKLKIRYNL